MARNCGGYGAVEVDENDRGVLWGRVRSLLARRNAIMAGACDARRIADERYAIGTELASAARRSSEAWAKARQGVPTGLPREFFAATQKTHRDGGA